MEKKKTEATKIPSISYSKLSLFKACPRQYYHRYIEKSKIKEVTYPGGLYGQACHLGLEQIIKTLSDGGTVKDVDGLLVGTFATLFEQAKTESKNTFKESREFREDRKGFMNDGDRALRSIGRFFTSYFQGWSELKSEAEYKFEWKPRVECVGIIDARLIWPDGSHSIVDLKITADGSNFWWVDWYRDTQSLMYDFLVYKHVGTLPKSFAYMVYDRTLKTLFVKERSIAPFVQLDVNDPEYVEPIYFSLDNRIDILARFNEACLDDECVGDSLSLSIAKPSMEGCKWCPWSKTCTKKWESKNVLNARRMLKRG